MTDMSQRPHPVAGRPANLPPIDFARSPFIVIWEATRACALACLHCRADAIAQRNPLELSTDEACMLINQVRDLTQPPPLFVITGGDPIRRPDLATIVRYAAECGLIVALTPSGTAATTRARIQELKDAGLSRLAVSLDGPDASTHDAFRGVRGSFDWTMRIIDAAMDVGLELQINTTVSKLTLPQLESTAARIRSLPLSLWAVFFLVQTGRGASLEQITADECEGVLNYLYDLSSQVSFGIKTTEAPHFQRVIRQRNRANGVTTASSTRSGLRATRSVTDGNGFVFVDHVGNVCPSGFLPLVRGNIRTGDLGHIYRDDDVFLLLRDTEALEGKCGECEFRNICGGSRARAYTSTGSLMGSDPLCAYEPAGSWPKSYD